MGELEEKLNAILGDQAAMGQIMALAQSLGKPASHSQTEGAKEENGWEPVENVAADLNPPQTEISPLGALNSLDPRLIQLGIQLWQEYQEGDERTTELLQALRPFLRKERRAKLDRAVQIARLSHVIRVALQTLGERGEEHHV